MAGDYQRRVYFLQKKGIIGKRASDLKRYSTQDIFRLARIHGFDGGFQGQGISSRSGRSVTAYSTEVDKEGNEVRETTQKVVPTSSPPPKTPVLPQRPPGDRGILVPIENVQQTGSTPTGAILTARYNDYLITSEIKRKEPIIDRGYSPSSSRDRPNTSGIINPDTPFFGTKEDSAEFGRGLSAFVGEAKKSSKSVLVGGGRTLTKIFAPGLEPTISSNRPEFKKDPAVKDFFTAVGVASAGGALPKTTQIVATGLSTYSAREKIKAGDKGGAAVSAGLAVVLGTSAAKDLSRSTYEKVVVPVRRYRQARSFKRLVKSVQDKSQTFQPIDSKQIPFSAQQRLTGGVIPDRPVLTSSQAKLLPDYNPLAHPLSGSRFSGRIIKNGKVVDIAKISLDSAKVKQIGLKQYGLQDPLKVGTRLPYVPKEAPLRVDILGKAKSNEVQTSLSRDLIRIVDIPKVAKTATKTTTASQTSTFATGGRAKTLTVQYPKSSALENIIGTKVQVERATQIRAVPRRPAFDLKILEPAATPVKASSAPGILGFSLSKIQKDALNQRGFTSHSQAVSRSIKQDFSVAKLFGGKRKQQSKSAQKQIAAQTDVFKALTRSASKSSQKTSSDQLQKLTTIPIQTLIPRQTTTTVPGPKIPRIPKTPPPREVIPEIPPPFVPKFDDKPFFKKSKSKKKKKTKRSLRSVFSPSLVGIERFRRGLTPKSYLPNQQLGPGVRDVAGLSKSESNKLRKLLGGT